MTDYRRKSGKAILAGLGLSLLCAAPAFAAQSVMSESVFSHRVDLIAQVEGPVYLTDSDVNMGTVAAALSPATTIYRMDGDLTGQAISVARALDGSFAADYGVGQLVSSRSSSASQARLLSLAATSYSSPGVISYDVSFDRSEEGISLDDSGDIPGPKVQDVYLSETYYEKFNAYSESVNNACFFYSNVGNNGITSQPVNIDFPDNLVYSAEKDGKPYAYTSRTNITETGTYVFHINLIEDSSKPVSEQVVYQTTYHFRIQPKNAQDPATTSADSSAKTGDKYSSDYYATFLQQTAQTAAAAASSAAGAFFPAAEGTSSESRQSSQSTGVQASLQSTAAETLASEAAPAESAESGNGVTYDTVTGYYTVTYDRDHILSVNVPNGMITNDSVMVDTGNFADEAKLLTFLRDGQIESLPAGGMIREDGNYLIKVDTGSGTETYNFRILTAPVDSLDAYTLPEGILLDAALKDGQTIPADQIQNSGGVTRILFTQSGSYELDLHDTNGRTFRTDIEIKSSDLDVVMTKESDGSYHFTYNADTLDHIVILRGKQERTETELTEVRAPGKYTVRFCAKNGEEQEFSFTISRKINTASIIAIVLILALIAAAVVLFIMIRRNQPVA